ncbi:MAG: hypothetical protein J4F50_00140 [Acidimicrobiia bacterium]|nr:hypothetical protein [Acidimicrobiia bacterium]
MTTGTALTRRWRAAALPALIATVPLVGMSLQGDERPRVYSVISRYSSNPFKMIKGTYDELDFFLSRGNFRPVGRLLETVEHGFIFEAGEATGLAPHVVHGVIRLLMVVLLAGVAASVVAALARSAGATAGHPLLVLYPLILGTVLVASGSHGPDAPYRWFNHITLVHFPHTIIGAVVLVLGIALVVARDRDMETRPVRRAELAAMAGLGGLAAVFYDLVYLAPALAAVFVAARVIAAGRPVKEILATAAVKRWAALSVGFLVVFIPVRIEIARRCSEADCYVGTDISLSPDVLNHFGRRLIAGTPPAGWLHNAELARHFGIDLGLRDLATNALTGILLVAIAAVAVATVISVSRAGGHGRNLARPGVLSEAAETGSPPRSPLPRVLSEAAETGSPPRSFRLALALALIGAAGASLSALLASLVTVVQNIEPRAIDAWRETLLTQVAWSFLISACLAATLGAVRYRSSRQIAVGLAAALLAASLTATLLANWRMAQADRQTPLSSITSQISAAVINLDTTENGNARRCSLIDAYSELVPDHLNMGGPAVQEHLDHLMLQRHGWPFCDRTRY